MGEEKGERDELLANAKGALSKVWFFGWLLRTTYKTLTHINDLTKTPFRFDGHKEKPPHKKESNLLLSKTTWRSKEATPVVNLLTMILMILMMVLPCYILTSATFETCLEGVGALTLVRMRASSCLCTFKIFLGLGSYDALLSFSWLMQRRS